MIFERTKKDMAALEIRDQVTVYDAFRLFRDFCEVRFWDFCGPAKPF